MSLTINGQSVEFKPGETVLHAAKHAGIDIPHLCALDWAASPASSCRVCVVEVKGQARLQTSCSLQAAEGMEVQTHTQRVLNARRNVMELLLANHPQDCLVCPRNGTCELSDLASRLGARPRRYLGARKSFPIDVSSPALVRDPNKCILCGRCVTMCKAVQGIGAIDFSARGVKTQVTPGFQAGMNVSGCIFCGQCTRVCPTAALTEKSSIEETLAALADPSVMVVAQIAPAVPATLLDGGEGGTVRSTLERLAAALRRVGFDAVFDTSFAADLTIMEEVSELIDRVKSGGPLPMFTSCSPAWVRYVELYRPDVIPYMSTCKSPQQMAGALVKELMPRREETKGRRVVCVAVMPCTAKKFEADGSGDVDIVLTTRELTTLLRRFGVELEHCTDRAPLDSPFSEATGAGRLFAGTGGVMEAAIRAAAKMLGAKEPKGGLRVSEARGMEGVKCFTTEVGGTTLSFAVVNGIGHVGPILKRLGEAKPDLHFVEVMSCPGGCVGGGGQPYKTDIDAVRARLERLYEADRHARRRTSLDNEQVQDLYREVLGVPLDHESHRLLHRTYTDRSTRHAHEGCPAASSDHAPEPR